MTGETFTFFQIPDLYTTALFEALPGRCILLQNDAPKFTILATTPDYVEMIGTTKEYLVGKGIFEAYPPNGDDPTDTGSHDVRASLELVRLHKKPHQLPVQRYDVAGEDGQLKERYWSAVNKPVFAPDGDVAYIIHAAEDITAQVKAERREEQIKNIEKTYALFMQAPVAINILVGSDLRIDLANAPSLEIWGKGEEIIGSSLLDVVPELQGQEFEKQVALVRKTGVTHHAYEERISLIRNGIPQDAYFNWVLQPVFEDGQSGAIGVITFASEVTEQVLAKKLVLESNEELQLALDIADLGTFRLDLLTNKATNSDKVSEWFGYTVQGYTREEGFNPIHPGDRDRVDQVILNTLQSEERSRHDVSYRVVHPITGAVRHLRSFGKALFNGDGKPYLIIGIIQEVTSQILHKEQLEESEALLQHKVLERTEELESLNGELKRSNSNLQQFAYAASHDLKEPVRKIHFFSERLKDSLGERLQETEKQYLQRMELASKRMSTLIDDLLTYSEVSHKPVLDQDVDLNLILDCVLSDLDLEVEQKGATIQRAKLFTIKGQRRQMQQAFQNLISNAIKYSKPDAPPVVRITCSKVKGADAGLQLVSDQQAKEFYQVTIMDNGIGFDRTDADRIFNVFTRLHGLAEYKGSGIGLSIVRKVIENHNGHVWAESQPGEGATFKILLPAD
jgi:PAS domain S-box-containing protein